VKPARKHRAAAQLDELPGDVGARHGDDLDGQRELAHDIDQLALVDDADELLGAGGDDLLARQRAAAALDHGHVRGDLVGAVDVDFHLAGFIQVDDADAVFFQALGGGHRRGDGGFDLSLDVGQFIDEKIGG
jgi:hypothetical protein